MAELTTQAQPVHSTLENKDGIGTGSNQEVAHNHTSEKQPEETERNARVDAVWQQMNKGVPLKTLNSILQRHSSPVKSSPIKSSKASSNWMTVLGLAPKKASSPVQSAPEKNPNITRPETSEDAKKLAAAALSAVKDAVTAAASSNRGKIEVSEVRDFAGEEIEVKKYIDADSDKGKAQARPTSAVDAVLEQIRKKQKLSVLDKTKKDWVEYKEENKGVEEELDAYKKSSNQYLDKVNFLERADYREFERERDARLATQARRKPDNMREDF